MERDVVIGVDAGNTKTAVIAVTMEGHVVASNRVAGANYQTIGVDRTLASLLDAIHPVAREVASLGLEVASFGFGLTGLDRPRDRAVLEPLVAKIIERVAETGACARGASRIVLNDACLVLRAGSDDDVGIAVSSGTGGNCVGRNREDRRVQVGGLASELGDGGGAHDIAIMGLKAAGRARDGRAWRTSIADKVMHLLGLNSIEDLMDFTIPGNAPDGTQTPPQPGLLAPIIFEAASEGDLVAIEILIEAGRQLGIAARRAASMLFSFEDTFPVVLGGSVLMNNPDSVFARAIVAELQTEFPKAVPKVLEYQPVVGAALLALDLLADRSEALREALRSGELRRRIGERV